MVGETARFLFTFRHQVSAVLRPKYFNHIISLGIRISRDRTIHQRGQNQRIQAKLLGPNEEEDNPEKY